MEGGDATYFAKTMTDLQRDIIALCAKGETFGYSRLAEKTGVTYSEARAVGHYLQSANLAHISLLKPGFNGSGIFLNDRGEAVKNAVLRLRERKVGRPEK